MYQMWFSLAIIVQYFIFGWPLAVDPKNIPACSLDVDSGLIKINQPLIVSPDGKDYSLVLPEKNDKKLVIKVTENEKVILICPGVGNELSTTHQDSVVMICKQNQLQTEKGNQLIIGTDQLLCKKQISPQIKKTEERCGENSQSHIYEIGYMVKSINKWFTILTVCHDAANMNTIYSINTLEGKLVNARQKKIPRPTDYMEGDLKELYAGGSPYKFYDKKNQVQKFRDLFKPENVDKYVDMYYRHLARGHLTPDADMLLSSGKAASYMYINVAPQWQLINTGNWRRVENQVRDAAIRLQDDFTIITGTYGVTKLRVGQTEHEIYLAPSNKLRVPEQFWKVVYHKKTQSAIVIISSNNPYNRVQPLCSDVCGKYNWAQENFQGDENLKRGFTYCCTYEDFQKVVTYVPSLAVKGTYIMPKISPLDRFRSVTKKMIKNNRPKEKKQ